MKKLKKDLILKPYSDSHWQLVNDFFFYFDRLDKTQGIAILIVPKGFITDFASVPKILWSVVPPIGRHTKAAIVHDYLYHQGDKMGITRKRADYIFLEAMKILNVSKFKRTCIFIAVRIFGGKYFKKY